MNAEAADQKRRGAIQPPALRHGVRGLTWGFIVPSCRAIVVLEMRPWERRGREAPDRAVLR